MIIDYRGLTMGGKYIDSICTVLSEDLTTYIDYKKIDYKQEELKTYLDWIIDKELNKEHVLLEDLGEVLTIENWIDTDKKDISGECEDHRILGKGIDKLIDKRYLSVEYNHYYSIIYYTREVYYFLPKVKKVKVLKYNIKMKINDKTMFKYCHDYKLLLKARK